MAFVFFLRLGVVSLEDEGEERAVAAGAFLSLPVVFAALPAMAFSLGLRMRWMLVLKEAPVICFPFGATSEEALSQSI